MSNGGWLLMALVLCLAWIVVFGGALFEAASR